jgi:hypothetical protein
MNKEKEEKQKKIIEEQKILEEKRELRRYKGVFGIKYE